MLKKSSSQEPLGQFQPKHGRKHAWKMGIQIYSKKGTGLFWGPIRGKIRKILINIQKSSSYEPMAGMH